MHFESSTLQSKSIFIISAAWFFTTLSVSILVALTRQSNQGGFVFFFALLPAVLGLVIQLLTFKLFPNLNAFPKTQPLIIAITSLIAASLLFTITTEPLPIYAPTYAIFSHGTFPTIASAYVANWIWLKTEGAGNA